MWLKGELIDSRLHQISAFCNIIDVSGGVTKVGLTTRVFLIKKFVYDLNSHLLSLPGFVKQGILKGRFDYLH